MQFCLGRILFEPRYLPRHIPRHLPRHLSRAFHPGRMGIRYGRVLVSQTRDTCLGKTQGKSPGTCPGKIPGRCKKKEVGVAFTPPNGCVLGVSRMQFLPGQVWKVLVSQTWDTCLGKIQGKSPGKIPGRCKKKEVGVAFTPPNGCVLGVSRIWKGISVTNLGHMPGQNPRQKPRHMPRQNPRQMQEKGSGCGIYTPKWVCPGCV